MMKKNFKLFAISLFTLLVSISQANIVSGQDKPGPADQAPDRAKPTQVKKADVPGIRNFSQINGTVGFGGTMVGFGGATQPYAMAGLK
jgi:hypothetical protein